MIQWKHNYFYLAEVGNRNNWHEITRQMIMGRPNFKDIALWVITEGGEGYTRYQNTVLLHRNINQKRCQSLNSQLTLGTYNLDLEDYWNRQGSGNTSNDPLLLDDRIVIKTRVQFERLRTALKANPKYSPRVLGIFAHQDMFNDRNEEDLISM